MSGTLFLSGGGDPDVSAALDTAFFAQLTPGARILYVPVALQRDMLGYEACFDWFSSLIALHAGAKELECTMLLAETPIPALDAFDAVFIGGGNTYRLMHYLRASGFGTALQAYLAQGGIVYGGSAGAIVMGRSIATVPEENTQGATDHRGLDLLGGASLICHYTVALDTQVAAAVATLGSAVLALPEDAGFIVRADGSQCIGFPVRFAPDAATARMTDLDAPRLVLRGA